jgi:two-component system, OmpR family, response regulator
MPSTSTSGRILIVDDDPGIRETLADFLAGEGYVTILARNVAEARIQLDHAPNLILLDLTMPGGDGLAFAIELRARSSIPIMIISGKSQTIDRVVGLEVGADDYLAKPFELRELLARVRALLRRSQPGTDVRPETAPEVRSASFGGSLVLLPGRRQVLNQSGAVIDLTPQEYNLLVALIERPRRVHSRDAISDLMRRTGATSDDRNIDAMISRLRSKLDKHCNAASLIQTVRGEGYVLASEVRWSGDPES